MDIRRILRSIGFGAAVAVISVGGIAAPATAAVAPSITLSPSSGAVGSLVTVKGTNFPKQADGSLTAETTVVRFVTSKTGTINLQIAIPETASKVITISAKTPSTSAAAAFTVTYSAVDPEPTATPPPTTAPAPTAVSISSARLRFGVSTPGGPGANAELDQVAAIAGEQPSIVLSYKDFNQAPPIAELDNVFARGGTTLLTWEPWSWGGAGVDQPAYANARIVAGDYDTYLREWGSALANWGKPVMMRYAHEMNGTWYPWADGVNGNASGSYVAAWRHVHDVLLAQGAANVSWVWSPNIPYYGSVPLASLYPGTTYVDVAALDGYNWGTANAWSSWATPQSLFGPGLDDLRTLASGKQILIAETASAEAGGSKAAWNTSLVSYLNSQTDVTGVVWFDHNKEVDWRIDSSIASADALKSALAARR